VAAAYSIDLRQRVVSAYQDGKRSQKAVAALFLISHKTLENYLSLERKTGSLAPRQTKRGRKAAIQESGLRAIQNWVNATPDVTLLELCERYRKTQKLTASLSMMCRACQKLGLTRKKKSPYASEQDRPDIKKARRFYRCQGGLADRKSDCSG
jgi:transposase